MDGGEEVAPQAPVEEEFDLSDILAEEVSAAPGSKEELLRRADLELQVTPPVTLPRCGGFCVGNCDLQRMCMPVRKGTKIWTSMQPAAKSGLLWCWLRCAVAEPGSSQWLKSAHRGADYKLSKSSCTCEGRACTFNIATH